MTTCLWIIRTTPYNQSFMYYALLGVAAVALDDLQRLDGGDDHAETVDRYRRIVRAGIATFVDHSDVTAIDGTPYVFQSHSPADRYEQKRWTANGFPGSSTATRSSTTPRTSGTARARRGTWCCCRRRTGGTA